MQHATIDRFERAALRSALALTHADRRRRPSVGAEAMEIAGGAAQFCGVGSVLTHAIAVGRHGRLTSADLDSIELFYSFHETPFEIDISPLVDRSVEVRLEERGYTRSCEEVLFHRTLDGTLPPVVPLDGVRIRRLRGDERARHADLLAEAAVAPEPPSGMLREVGLTSVTFPSSEFYIAETSDGAVATAATGRDGTLGSLFGGATQLDARRRGIQRTLIAQRLVDLLRAGVEEVTVVASPNTTSARNAERAGFRPLYSRTVWCSPPR